MNACQRAGLWIEEDDFSLDRGQAALHWVIAVEGDELCAQYVNIPSQIGGHRHQAAVVGRDRYVRAHGQFRLALVDQTVGVSHRFDRRGHVQDGFDVVAGQPERHGRRAVVLGDWVGWHR